MRAYANLHLHSTHSDGKYTPAELVDVCVKEGYRAMAVTDHDTVTANAEVRTLCAEKGIGWIFGAEFTVPGDMGPGSAFHIVAFDFDPDYPKMRDYLDGMAERESSQTREIFRMGLRAGTISGLSWEDVLECSPGVRWLCNEHVYRAMIARGLAKPEGYYDWFNLNYRNQRSLVPPSVPFLGTAEMLRLILDAGGIPVLAHPHRQLSFVPRLMELGLMGIEVWHPDLTPEEQTAALALAYEKGLFISGGTDHSGLCGGMYASFQKPEESGFWTEPCAFGTMEQHWLELKSRSLRDRRPFSAHYTAVVPFRNYD